MRRILSLTALAVLAAPALVLAQGAATTTRAEPFKLGTFAIDDIPRIGLVLQDKLVVELDAANRALERNPVYPELEMPEDMVELIGRYEYGLKHRLYEIVNDLVRNGGLTGTARPGYVHDVSEVDILAPLMPRKIMNAAVNFYSHVGETGTAEEQKKAAEERRRNRGVPYLFLKPPSAVIGHGDNIVLPWGRDRIDWEVELGIVIGRAAKYVSAKNAQDYIFGYTVHIDVSDRGGRPPGGFGLQSDWFVGKGHDTFAPLGPWIVPKEFYGDPMERLEQTLTVDGQMMQSARAGDMIHSIYEIIEYASSLITLYPGDVVDNGTSGGTGMGTAYRGEQQFLQPGDKVVASIEGIGTLEHGVVAEEEPPPGTGSRLPPVSSYRRESPSGGGR